MEASSWPSKAKVDEIRKTVAELSARSADEVKIVISPYRICPLGAHIDHQGGTVTAMTIDKGILLAFVPSGDSQVLLRSGQFKGEVRFSVDQILLPRNEIIESAQKSNVELDEECKWGTYARGAVYALQRRGNKLTQGIIGFICGSEGLDSSGLSSSAAVGVAYLLAFERANNLAVPHIENIEYDRLIENEYLGLKNGILDQSAILLSSYGCLTCMNCKTKEHKLIRLPKYQFHDNGTQKAYKILLASSGLKQALTSNSGYNSRVAECRESARLLLHASGNEVMEHVLSNVEPESYELHKCKLDPTLAKRAEHYFSEEVRVKKGLEAWASGKLEEFGKLISASGLSSIQKYECGCEPLIQLYEIILRAPGVYGCRFSGAGFRGCCIAFVDAARAEQAASFVRTEYRKAQPELIGQISPEKAVIICDAGDCARVI
ncbi:galacturonokinase [Impatiens glandulifera]|uniref:galacturonokinase n=1 Tax=Impatiens glandulifera TaxID=253017 RepID=UPI001FB13178|nr:galacturonokinase [Impatiens glandulifera]